MEDVDQEQFDRVAKSFEEFHKEFAPLFGRKEARARSEQYLRGLLVQQTDRRNAENLAEAVEGATPRSLQRFLTEAPWDTELVIERLQGYVGERLNSDDGVWVLDETGFAKQGKQSVGVARQYSGTLGKVGNCQVGVFLAYGGSRGHALVDKRLYLPKQWTEDQDRCRRAGVPEGVGFRTKSELALSMLWEAREWGHLQSRWVTGDEEYGKVPDLRDELDTGGWWYVLEVPSNLTVWDQMVETAVPQYSGRGRKPKVERVVGDATAVTVKQVSERLESGQWQELAVAEGEQGPRRYRFAAVRVWENRDGLPGRECWLVLRTNPDGSEPKYYVSNAPQDTRLCELGRVGALRWAIETQFQVQKGETGLDEYEVRTWRGWHHHITLALLAGAFLLNLQQEWGGKDARDHQATGKPGVAGVATPKGVDARGPARMAASDPRAQRESQTLPRQAPSQHAA
ncbi:MAG: IS701 family transposase [Chloroflexota bacterium]|nr:IS701 family transposase [Chloroflexota bacterium]